MMITKRLCCSSLAFVALLTTQSQAAVYTIEWATGTGTAPYVTGNVTLTPAANTSGTIPDRVTGLNTFDHDATGGWLRFGRNSNLTALTTQDDLANSYWTFTVTADAGYTLDLTSLDFNARRATNSTSNIRGFEVWATVNGNAFDIDSAGDQRLLRILSPDEDTLAVRNGSDPFSITLGSAFQGIESVTFRIYHLATDTTFNGIEFGDVTLNGQVIPEPTAALLGGLGAFTLLLRRRNR